MSLRALIALVATTAFGFAPYGTAGVIVETPNNLASLFSMTGFPEDPRGDNTTVTSVTSPLGGSIEFWTQNHGAPLAMTLDKDSGWFPANLERSTRRPCRG